MLMLQTVSLPSTLIASNTLPRYSITCPVPPAVYDFGPNNPSAAAAGSPATDTTPAVPLGLAELRASSALDGTAMLYRLAYADPTQLRRYALARWSMPPAQLLRQRVRAGLASRFSVVPAEQAQAERQLRIELEEFSQVFDAPERSSALLRVHASLVLVRDDSERLLGQRSFTVTQGGAGADAPGGVRAMAEASDSLVRQLEQWLLTVR